VPPAVPAPDPSAEKPREANPFTAELVRQILANRGWLPDRVSPEHQAWCERAAALLGPQVANTEELERLLELVFHYDASGILSRVDAHATLSRRSAREVIRALAHALLRKTPLDSERLKEVVGELREQLDLRSRDLFQPIRLALAGRAGEGDLDRVILLLDEGAQLPWATPVKSARRRIVEFCSALD
jgi:glutamyl/glutaminyl-tRNA synthetase